MRDAVFTLRMLMRQAFRYQQPLHMAFVDLKKAFDSVSREALWAVLKGYGVELKLIELLRDLHEGTQAAVRVGGCFSKWFDIKSGVRQGCVIAPCLFNVFIDFVIRLTLSRMPANCGVKVAFCSRGTWRTDVPHDSIPTEGWLSQLLYADDMVLTCSSAAELKMFLQLLDAVCAECGLHINAAKTVVMSVDRRGSDPLPTITLSGGVVEQVQSFKYLGSILTSLCDDAVDIAARIGKAAAAVHQLTHIWRSKELTTKTKTQIYNTCVLQTLLFGCESWVICARSLQRLSVFHNDCLRRILGVKRRDRHHRVELYSSCQTVPLENLLRHRRLQWLGSVQRMGPERMPRMALCRVMRGKLPRGRPPKSWESMVLEDLAAVGVQPAELEEMCANRKAWGKMLAEQLLKPP